MSERKAEGLGLTKNNDRYKNVPDDLKWAIPLIEIQRDPAFLAKQRQEQLIRSERIKKEMATRKRAAMRLVKNS